MSVSWTTFTTLYIMSIIIRYIILKGKRKKMLIKVKIYLIKVIIEMLCEIETSNTVCLREAIQKKILFYGNLP